MNLRTKIMASFANLEADLRTRYGKRVDDPADDAAMALSWVRGAHDWFNKTERAEPEAVVIEVDELVGYVE